MKRKLLLVSVLVFLALTASAQHPSIGGYNVYYGSLHNHSNVSDGSGTPATAYSYAKNTAHLDFFGLSDHSTYLTSAQWSDIRNQADASNQDGVFTTFYGFEWSSKAGYGHVTVFNTADYCPATGSTLSLSDLLIWLQSRQAGLAYFNHPGDEDSIGIEFNHFSATPSNQMIGIELWNRNRGFSRFYYNDGYYRNDNNKSYIDEANNRGWRLGALGSDDNHNGTWGTDVPYRMAILSNSLTRSDLLAAMQARRFFATLDKNLSLSFKINGMEMGSVIPGNSYAVQIQAADADGEIFTQAVIYNQNHDIVNTWTLNTAAVNLTLNLTTKNGEYYYVKVTEADGDEAISSPVWISGTSTNKFPVCSISSPSDGAAFAAPANITINATASDPDGSISKVEFYNGSVKLGEDLTSPYTFTWSGVTTGSYNLIVKATDNLGAVTASSAVSVTVGGIPITVTADTKTKVYGESDPVLTYRITSGSLTGSDTFTGSLTRDEGESAGNHTIRRGTLSLGSKYVLTFITANLTITARPVSIRADGKTKIYGSADPPLTYVITSGSLAGDDQFSGTLTRDAGEDVGTYAITQGSLSLGSDYNMTFAASQLTITVRAITVTADNVSKEYGDADHLTYRITSGSLAGKDTFTGSLTRTAGEDPGTYAISRGTLALGSNYSLTFIGANLSITARAIAVSADSRSKVYGDADLLTYRITSGTLLAADSFSGALARDPGETLGIYTIRQGTLALNRNYVITFSGSTLNITQRPVRVSADVKTKVYGDYDPDFTYRITLGSLVYSDSFSGSLTRSQGENTGSYQISQGNLALSSNYVLTFTGAKLDITPRPITVTADAVSKLYGESDPELTYSITSGNLAGNGDSFKGELIREAGENAGTYKIKQGTLAIDSNYTLTFLGADFAIDKSGIVIAADAKSKIYGVSDPVLTYHITSGSLKGQDKIVGELSREQGENVGAYNISQGTMSLSNNYEVVFVKSDLEITPRPVTVTANPKKKVHGEPDPLLTYNITSGSLVGEDSINGSLARKTGETVGTYPIERGTLAIGDNYNLDFEGADFIILSDYEIKAYPNPFSDHLRFEVELNFDYDVTLEIFNESGSKIATVFSGKANAGFHSFEYLPKNIVRGFLIYRITINGHAQQGKIIHI